MSSGLNWGVSGFAMGVGLYRGAPGFSSNFSADWYILLGGVEGGSFNETTGLAGVIGTATTNLPGTIAWSVKAGSDARISINSSSGAVSTSSAIYNGDSAAFTLRADNGTYVIEFTFTAVGTVNAYVLDAMGVSASMAYGLRKLRSAYAGNCIKVRRSSDSTTQNIGFSGNALDTTALLAFVGAGNGYIDTWYDQSGNGRDAVQAGAANQPQIVSAGALVTKNGKAAARFAGSQYLTGPTVTFGSGILGGSGIYSLAAAASVDTVGAYQSIIDCDDSSNRLFQFRINPSGYFEDIAFNAGAVAFTCSVNTSIGNNTLAIMVSTRNTSVIPYLNGTAGSATAIDNLRNSGAAFTIGRRASGSQALTGYVSETFMFPSELGTSARDALESNLGAYLGITVV